MTTRSVLFALLALTLGGCATYDDNPYAYDRYYQAPVTTGVYVERYDTYPAPRYYYGQPRYYSQPRYYAPPPPPPPRNYYPGPRDDRRRFDGFRPPMPPPPPGAGFRRPPPPPRPDFDRPGRPGDHDRRPPSPSNGWRLPR
ncbi:hypothetical protein [Pseudomonas sp. LRF_L74]|uniref:hypothetical protein n=1 Tax=Pseudomonas sp. LRF_L74 TaxID=3369422 RepID=UPI003F61133D